MAVDWEGLQESLHGTSITLTSRAVQQRSTILLSQGQRLTYVTIGYERLPEASALLNFGCTLIEAELVELVALVALRCQDAQTWVDVLNLVGLLMDAGQSLVAHSSEVLGLQSLVSVPQHKRQQRKRRFLPICDYQWSQTDRAHCQPERKYHHPVSESMSRFTNSVHTLTLLNTLSSKNF